MSFSVSQTIGLLVSVLGIAGLAIYSGTKPQARANANHSPIIAGIIMGTLVGGSSTVGTAQLAYDYGLSAWWFTLGGGIACLLLAFIYCVPWRRSGCPTLNGIISKEYGPRAGLTSSMLSAVGTFINIISQLISGTAVIAVVAPSLGLVPSLVITAMFMAMYVMFGGTRGVGTVGILKLILLYVSMIGCGLMVLMLCGGLNGFLDMVKAIDDPDGVNFFSLFARGGSKDFSACLSLILGVLTTQTYAQALMSGRSDKDARAGALISAVLIPPIGAGGILVGLYMRANYPGILAKTALTAFATEHLPGLLSGLVLGTLFIAVVGTGAGLAMGISTILRREIIQRYSDKLTDANIDNALSKAIIALVLALGVYLSSSSLGDTILNFAFMSMGLRGAVVFAPMCCALWLPGRINRSWVLAAIIAGPLAVLVFGAMLPLPGGVDSLFAGVAASLLCCMAGLAVGNRKPSIRLMGKSPMLSDRLVIAIDSEAYSGGEEVARSLAEKLGVPCYGKEILTEAAAISGISERLFVKYDGVPVTAAYDLSAKDESTIRLPPAGDFISAQIAACKKLANNGPCILVDRFASKALENTPGCIKVFVHADFENRAAACAELDRIGPAAARRKLKKLDRARKRYYKGANKNWGYAGSYTLSINASGANPHALADGMVNYLAPASATEQGAKKLAATG